MNQKPVLKIRLMWLSGLMLLLLFLAIITLNVCLPVRYAKLVNRQTTMDSAFMADQGLAVMHPAITALAHEKAFKTSMLQLSQSDSLALLIEPSDSIVSLLMKGVSLHGSTTGKIEFDPFFDMIGNAAYLRLFSSPATIVREKANIPKEPLVRIKQPSGPEEAAMNATTPDTAINKNIYLTLELDNGISIFLYSPEAYSNPLWHHLSWVGRQYRRLMESAVHGYRPLISISLPEKELLALYRALPVDGRVLVKF